MDTAQDSIAVLIVEDDDDLRESLTLLLQEHGFRAAGARNGSEALHLLRGGLRPRLILLDLNMPYKNGWQFRVEQILDPRIETIPIIAYSGDAQAHADSVRLGAVACLRKPIQPDQLIALVRAQCSE